MPNVLDVVESVAGGVARARKARAVHPRGRAYQATLTVSGGAACGVPLLDQPGAYRATVRLSRGIGLPDGWPDVLGFAVRVHGGDGPGADVDLLVSTALGRAPGARHVPMPRLGFDTTYTTIAGYATPRGRRYLAVLPGYSLAVATALGRWRVIGGVRLGAPVPGEGLAFDPIRNTATGLRPAGLLWRL